MKTAQQRFTEQFKQKGWSVLYSEKYAQPRLYNIHSQVTPPSCQIKREYQDFLEIAKNEPEGVDSIESYVLRSLPTINGTRFKPTNESIFTCQKSGCKFANSYKPFESKNQPIELSPLFHEFFERMFPVPYERETIQKWLSHMLKKPLERPSWHLLLTSDTGTGKGFLFSEILSKLVQNSTCVASFSSLFGEHSRVLESNLLVLLDDPKSNHDATMTKLKSCLSEPTIYVNPKGIDGYSSPTYTRVILASNELRPLRLDANERRWFAPKYMTHKESRDETQLFIKKLCEWLDIPGAIESVHTFFMEFDITDFNCKFINQTETLKSMIEQSKNCYEDALLDFLKDKNVFTFAEAREAIVAAGYKAPLDAAINYILAEQKYQKKRIRIDGQQGTYWFPVSMAINEVKTHLVTVCKPSAAFLHY